MAKKKTTKKVKAVETDISQEAFEAAFPVDTDDCPDIQAAEIECPHNPDDCPDKVEAPVLTERTIIVSVLCTASAGCCGGKGKSSTKTAIAKLKKNGSDWDIIEISRLYGNVLTMAKAHGLWVGSAFSMGLHENKKFIADLTECGTLKTGCRIVE